MNRKYDKKIVKVDIPFTFKQADLFKTFINKSGRKIGPYIKQLVLADMVLHQNLELTEISSTFTTPGPDRISLNLVNPDLPHPGHTGLSPVSTESSTEHDQGSGNED